MVLDDARRAIFHNRADQPFASKELQTFVNATMKHVLERERGQLEECTHTPISLFAASVRDLVFAF